MRSLLPLERAILSDHNYRARSQEEHDAFDRLVDRGCLRYAPSTDYDEFSVWADITAEGRLALRLDVAFAISKLSPLQVGDRARLTETPEITPDKSWGWLGSKHMLVAGKCGVISSVDWGDGAFFYSWEPEEQTWISSSGEEKPVDRPSIFIFGQRWLERES